MTPAQRFAAARAVKVEASVWTGAAIDMLRIAALAGFDIPALKIRCVKRTRKYQGKMNAGTVENVMAEMYSEFD